MIQGRKWQLSSAKNVGGLFIDKFGAPAVAYSTRLLNSSYAGPCLRVRRSSDDAEQDIGFDSGALDESALSAFIGANSGYVTTWYDQSGNANDITETTTSEQPLIVNAGTIYKESGYVSLQSPANTTGFDTGLGSTTTKTAFIVANSTQPASAATGRLLTSYAGSGSVGSTVLLDYSHSSGVYRFFDGSKSVSVTASAGFNISYIRRNASSIGLSINGGSESTAASPTSSSSSTLKLFEEGGSSTNEIPTSMTEVIIYTSDQSGDKSGMLSDINGYYGIY